MRRQIARRRDQSLSPRRRGDQLHPTAQVPGLVRTQRRLGQDAALGERVLWVGNSACGVAQLRRLPS
jgi:hypothetical protein